MVKPIYIFSLPRSGSTLLQRVLTNSSQISSASEPWILLPYLYATKSYGIKSEYWHDHASNAINEFLSGMPNGNSDYKIKLKNFILSLYEKRSSESTEYFIDKTPRYHLIAEEIMDLFPEGKFIFLWRNPLAIIASMINSWFGGKWKIYLHRIDVYDGIINLINAFMANKNSALSVNFETFLLKPQQEMKRICEFLNTKFTFNMLKLSSKNLMKGSMGDKKGTKRYSTINKEIADSWKNVFNNPYRKNWAYKYLNWIGIDNLSEIGYNYYLLMDEIYKNKQADLSLMVDDIFTNFLYSIKNKLYPVR